MSLSKDERIQLKREREELKREQQWLDEREMHWAPPPHKNEIFGKTAQGGQTPIPKFYFQQAAAQKNWHPWMNDLVPVEQTDLIQEPLEPIDKALARIVSADARACISLCRPVGQFVEKRRVGRAGVWNTIAHQSGELTLYPMRPAEDEARGMLTGMVTRDSFRKEMFDLQAGEDEALELVIPWLLKANPWFSGYAHSAQRVQKEVGKVTELLLQERHALPGGLENMMTKDGRRLEEALESEEISLLLPCDPLKAQQGTYQHLRAAAETIAMSTLAKELPPGWKELCPNVILDRNDEALSTLPEFLSTNTSFTKVSFQDQFVEVKTFVRQFPYDTGGRRSTWDSVTDLLEYRHARLWSLDGEFLDNVDPQWTFWHREYDLKHKLVQDLRHNPEAQRQASQKMQQPGKRSQHTTSSTCSHNARSTVPQTNKRSAVQHDGRTGTTASPPKFVQRSASYSRARFSPRVGSLIGESVQALQRERFDCLEMARDENLGPPSVMTTYVGNDRSPAVFAHVLHGACAKPNPEDAVGFVTGVTSLLPATRHVNLRAANYLRRRDDFEHVAFNCGAGDNLHGRMRDWVRRSEAQQRGDQHEHYNAWLEKCGILFSTLSTEEMLKWKRRATALQENTTSLHCDEQETKEPQQESRSKALDGVAGGAALSASDQQRSAENEDLARDTALSTSDMQSSWAKFHPETW